jgi:hypothetical protein
MKKENHFKNIINLFYIFIFISHLNKFVSLLSEKFTKHNLQHSSIYLGLSFLKQLGPQPFLHFSPRIDEMKFPITTLLNGQFGHTKFTTAL